MEIFKKKKLLCFLFLFFAFIPFIKANALTLEELPALPIENATNNYEIVINKNNQVYLYYYEDNSLYTINGIENSYLPHQPYTITFGGTTTASPIEDFSDTIYAYTYQLNKTTNTWDYKGYLTTPTMYSAHDFNIFSSFRNDPTTITPYLKEKVIFSNVNHFYTSDNGQTFIQVLSSSDYGVVLEEKKKFSYNNDEMNNPMRYIDLYFDKEDFGKEINFELKLEDFFNYSSCEYCKYLDIDKFEFSYLIKDDNGLYKWVDYSNLDTGLYFDYTGETFPRNEDGTGLILNGKINFNFDTSVYNFERIRASIKLNNGYNFSYTYSDDSSITSDNIDEYYHYMTYNYGERLNRIEGGSTKYTILSTIKDNLNGALVVQYINTDKWLYAEYFDTFNHTYLENSNLFQEHYLFGGKDLSISKFTIGKNSNRGIYLMNYLYQKDDKNLNSKYYFYIPTEVSYSTTDFLDESVYYDNDGNFNSSITPNPNYETDNLRFIDNFRGIFNFLNDLQTTSDTFNYMWNSFYNTMPIIFQSFLKFATHILCLLIFMKIVGYE